MSRVLVQRVALLGILSGSLQGCEETSFGPDDMVAAYVAGTVLTTSGIPVNSAPIFFHVSRPVLPDDCERTSESTGVLRFPVQTGIGGAFEWKLVFAGRDLLGVSCLTVVAEPAGRLDLRADSVVRVPIEFRGLDEPLDSVIVTLELPPSSQ